MARGESDANTAKPEHEVGRYFLGGNMRRLGRPPLVLLVQASINRTHVGSKVGRGIKRGILYLHTQNTYYCV